MSFPLTELSNRLNDLEIGKAILLGGVTDSGVEYLQTHYGTICDVRCGKGDTKGCYDVNLIKYADVEVTKNA